VAAAALFAIWLQSGRQSTAAEAPVTRIATAGSASPATLAVRDAAAEPAALPVELMLNAPAARRVRLVGDFTGWDEKGVEMRRDAASGLWSATASVRPGRHVYAFIVDDSIWMRDPRAPVAPDSDFGQPGSLLIVGRP
jgi:1,4-alpha-glucan branching enzyme